MGTLSHEVRDPATYILMMGCFTGTQCNRIKQLWAENNTPSKSLKIIYFVCVRVCVRVCAKACMPLHTMWRSEDNLELVLSIPRVGRGNEK